MARQKPTCKPTAWSRNFGFSPCASLWLMPAMFFLMMQAVEGTTMTSTTRPCYTENDPDAISLYDYNDCQHAMYFGKTDGFINNPEWYDGSGLTATSSWIDWQLYVFLYYPEQGCAMPCGVTVDQSEVCEYYMTITGCGWTESFNCPGQPAGSQEPAENDRSLGYLCCCSFGFWQAHVEIQADTSCVDHPIVSTQRDTVESCQSACDGFTTCRYLAYCPAGTAGCEGHDSNNCVLYPACAENSNQGYTLYFKARTRMEGSCETEVDPDTVSTSVFTPCQDAMHYGKYDGFVNNPQWYNGSGLTTVSSWFDWQMYVSSQLDPQGCLPPCNVTSMTTTVQATTISSSSSGCYTEIDPLTISYYDYNDCQHSMTYARYDGFVNHPEWYTGTGLNANSTWIDWQVYVSVYHPNQGCLLPCGIVLDSPQANVLQSLGSDACTNSSQCGQCQGDCDADEDCTNGLRCFQRDSSSEHVPGCNYGGSGDVGSYDYCYQACPTGYMYSHEGYWSDMRDRTTGESPASCATRCNEDLSCVAMSIYVEGQLSCYLYSDPKGLKRESPGTMACLQASSTSTTNALMGATTTTMDSSTSKGKGKGKGKGKSETTSTNSPSATNEEITSSSEVRTTSSSVLGSTTSPSALGSTINKTILYTITMSDLSNFADIEVFTSKLKLAITNATIAIHTEPLVYVDSVGIVAELEIAAPAPDELVIQDALAEHVGVPSSAIVVTRPPRRLRHRRLSDASFSCEIDASADSSAGTTDIVQATRQMQAKLHDRQALESMITQMAGRNVTLSSMSSSVKLVTRSVIATVLSASDLESLNISTIVEQALGGTISQQSLFDGIILPESPSTSMKSDTSIAMTSSVALTGGLATGTGEDKDESLTIVILIVVIIGGVLFLAVLVLALFMLRRRYKHMGPHNESLRELGARLDTWGKYDPQVEALTAQLRASPFGLDSKTLDAEFLALKALLPKDRLSKKALFDQQKRKQDLSVALEEALENNKHALADEVRRSMDTLSKEIECMSTLKAKMDRFDELAEKIQDIQVQQDAAMKGTSCSFWFVDADKIISHPGKTLPSLQQLELVDSTWLVQRSITFEEACCAVWVNDTLVISHRWEDPDHPDKTGTQLEAIRQHLKKHPQFRYVWYDFWCMPQGKEKNTTRRQEFNLMLRNVSMLYLGASVLLLVDMPYMARFWTQFEAWLSLQKATSDGLVGAEPNERRCVTMCLHNAHSSCEAIILDMYGNKSAAEAKNILEKPDVAVTNEDDRDMQLAKLMRFDELVRNTPLEEARRRSSRYSRASRASRVSQEDAAFRQAAQPTVLDKPASTTPILTFPMSL